MNDKAACSQAIDKVIVNDIIQNKNYHMLYLQVKCHYIIICQDGIITMICYKLIKILLKYDINKLFSQIESSKKRFENKIKIP